MKKFFLVFLYISLFAGRLYAQQAAEASAIGVLASTSPASTSPASTLPAIERTAIYYYEQEEEEKDWNDKFLYLGLSLLWIPRLYSNASSYDNIVSVGMEITADTHILSFLSVRAGVELSQDLLIIDSSEIKTDMILAFPFAIAYVFSPLKNLMLEPYLGGTVNLSMQRNTTPYIFSWSVGVELCIKTGFGILTIEPRFAMDTGKSSLISFSRKETLEYERSTIHIGIGYKVGVKKRFF